MSYKDMRKLEEFKHECVLTQLNFERETRLILLQKQWELSFRKPVQRQPQYEYDYGEPLTNEQLEMAREQLQKRDERLFPEPQDVGMVEKSKEKYGGKK